MTATNMCSNLGSKWSSTPLKMVKYPLKNRRTKTSEDNKIASFVSMTNYTFSNFAQSLLEHVIVEE